MFRKVKKILRSVTFLGKGGVKLPLHCIQLLFEFFVLVIKLHVLAEGVFDDFVPFILALGQALL